MPPYFQTSNNLVLYRRPQLIPEFYSADLQQISIVLHSTVSWVLWTQPQIHELNFMNTVNSWFWNTATSNQVSNFDSVVLKVYYGVKWLKKSLNVEAITYNVLTWVSQLHCI